MKILYSLIILLTCFALFFLGKVIIGLKKLFGGNVLSLITSGGKVEALKILLLITILLFLIILILMELMKFLPKRKR